MTQLERYKKGLITKGELNCKHEHINRGIKFPSMKYFSFCKDCDKQWLDDGKLWEARE